MTEHPDITQLSAHLDGELDRTETARLSAHLLSCQACQRQYQAMRELSNDLRQLPTPEPELDLAALLGQLPERQQPALTQDRWRRALPGMAAAASLVMGLLIGSNMDSPASRVSEPTFAALAILDSTPPGALCRQPELCYLGRKLQ
ncbi:MAG: zf-HC2 domain-containing protein [Pseudomonas sp.]